MKIPKPRKLPSGSWCVQLRLGGESVTITRSSQKDAIRDAQLIKAEYLAGKRLPVQKEPPAAPTLSACIDAYIARRQNTLSPSTIDGYRRIQKNRFRSVMDQPISEETDWQKIIDNERCSPKTLRNAYRFIVSVLSENKITAPKITLPALTPHTRPWLEPDEITKLISSADGTAAALPVFLALHSLRRSELLALTWDNIDLDKKRLTVSGAIVQNENHAYVRKETNKTARSARTIPIMIPELMVLLSSTPKADRTGPLLTCTPHTVADRINAACRSAGLPEVGTHGLRHSFASLAYHLGMSELETMELGGWSDTQTMHRIYTHLASVDRLNAENKLTAFFSGDH